MGDAPRAEQVAEPFEHPDQREGDDPAAGGPEAEVPLLELEDRGELLVVAPDFAGGQLQVGPVEPGVKDPHRGRPGGARSPPAEGRKSWSG
jgi:hypothetical protein